MLQSTDIVVVKDAKGHVIATKEYERVHLSHAEGDELETVDVTSDGKTVGAKIRPKGVSLTDPETLFSAAVGHIQAEYPKSNPLLVILEAVEYALDLKARAAIRSSLLPAKIADPDKQVEKMAKTLMGLDSSYTLDTAKAKIRSLLPQ